MKTTTIFALTTLAAVLPGCEVDMCNDGATSMGGVCFPLDPVQPVCGNGVCEVSHTTKESAASCPADCDGGHLSRATLLSFLTVELFNDAVAGHSWPNGQVSTNATCAGGGSSAISGMAGRVGDDNYYQLTFAMSTCSGRSLSFLGELTVDGTFAKSGSFNNTTHTDTEHFSGSATLHGKDDDIAYGPVECAMEFDRVSTSTTSHTTGSLCGKALRSILYDDR